MNPIQEICYYLQSVPINGNTNNEPGSTLKRLLGDAVHSMPFGTLIPEGVEHIIVETRHDQDVSWDQKQLFKCAKVHFVGIEEPLVLDTMPAHMAHPTFPKQLFSQSNNMLKAIDNPYFSGDLDNVFKQTTLLYLSISQLAGYDGLETKIKRIEIDHNMGRIHTVYVDSLNPELLEQVKNSIDKHFSGQQEAYITHFVINFMPDMLHKTERSMRPVKVDGKDAMQNAFSPVDWPEEDKAKFLSELRHELSMVPVSDTCPAYIYHSDRINRYARTVMEDMMPFTFPITFADHGMDCDSWDAFCLTSQGMDIIEHFETALLNALESSNMNLDALLKAYAELNSPNGSH